MKQVLEKIVCVFAVIFCLAAARNLEPLTFPTIYAEDGSWVGAITETGWSRAAFTVRDFPVLGLVGMQRLGILVTDVLFAGDITKLPIAYFFVSNAFLAATATLAFMVFRGSMSLSARIVLALSIVLVPTGSSGNEIFGRILNLGFIFPVTQYLLIASTIENPRFWSMLFAALFSFISALTFPVGIAILGIGAFIHIVASFREEKSLRARRQLFAATLASLMIFSVLLIPATAFGNKGGADLPVNTNDFLEFAIARPFLYPIVSPFYHLLSDYLTIALMFILMATVIIALRAAWRTSNRSGFYRITFLVLTIATYFSIFLVMRRGLSYFFHGYQDTYPDRYFLGINILVVHLLIISLETCWPSNKWLLRVTPLLLIISFLLFGFPHRSIFELSTPKMTWRQLGTFPETVRAHVEHRGPLQFKPTEANTEVPIAPVIENHAWRIRITKEQLIKSGVLTD